MKFIAKMIRKGQRSTNIGLKCMEWERIYNLWISTPKICSSCQDSVRYRLEAPSLVTAVLFKLSELRNHFSQFLYPSFSVRAGFSIQSAHILHWLEFSSQKEAIVDRRPQVLVIWDRLQNVCSEIQPVGYAWRLVQLEWFRSWKAGILICLPFAWIPSEMWR